MEKILKLTNKKNMVFVKRGNEAIKQSLKIAYDLGKRKLLLCDQGGWLTYSQFGEKIGFAVITLKTDDGVLAIEELENAIGEDGNNCVLLIS